MTKKSKLLDRSLVKGIKRVDDIWNTIAVDQNTFRLTGELRAQLERRLDAYEEDRIPGRLATEVVSDIRCRLLK